MFLLDDVSSISGSDTSDYSNSENETKFLSVPLYSSSDSEKKYKNDQFGNRLPKFYLENENNEIISFYKKLVFSKEVRISFETLKKYFYIWSYDLVELII